MLFYFVFLFLFFKTYTLLSGFSKIVQLLLKHGATTALLDSEGNLIKCPQYEGVRMQIENHRLQHTKEVMALIMDRSRKAFEQLQKIWLVSLISCLAYLEIVLTEKNKTKFDLFTQYSRLLVVC